MTELVIHRDLIQGTDEWLQARCGVITASTIGKMLTPQLKVADNPYSRSYALSLAAERITGIVEPTSMTPDMWRGVELEPAARDAYAQHKGVEVEEVGLMTLGRVGYSPDGLVGDDGLIEIKCRRQRRQLETFLAGAVPAENMAQLQTGLMVSGRKWIDYVSFCPGMPMYVQRVTPSERWFEAIARAVDACEDRIAQALDAYSQAADGLPVIAPIPDDIRMDL